MPTISSDHRIAVLRALQLGDMLCSTPVLRALRAAYPDSRISLIGLPWSVEFTRRFPELIDEVLEFPGWPGLPEAPFDARRTLSFLADCQAAPFDLALQLHGSGVLSGPFVQLLGARETAGFYPSGMTAPGPGWVSYKEHGPEAERLLELARHLGWPDAGHEVTFPLRLDDWDEYEALSRDIGLRHRDYAVLHTGARDPLRRWPASKFAAVGDAIAGAGLRVLLTGTEAEHDQVERVASAMTRTADVLCGRTSLGALACLLHQARLLVSNDTGVAHVAAALDVPRVIIFTSSDPDRWTQGDQARARRFIEPSALMQGSCDAYRLNPAMRAAVDVDDVIEGALQLSTDEWAHAAKV